MRTSFENEKFFRKIIVFIALVCWKNYDFPNISCIFKASFQSILILKKPTQSFITGLHHTWRWFENSKPFSNYNIHFDLRIAQFTSTLRIRDTFVLDINNLLKIFGKFWFLTKCRNSNLLLYTWYNSVDTKFFGIGNKLNMNLKLTS